MKFRILTLSLMFLLFSSVAKAEDTLTIMTHDSFSISKEIVADFEQRNNAKVQFLKAGDAGAALNQAILTKKNPLADVFFGVDNTFLSRAWKADIFESYSSPMLRNIPKKLQLDTHNRLLPVSYGDVCLNIDKAWFSQMGLPAPQRLEDLIKPAYKGLTVVQNPATSSPGLAFLLATVAHFGEQHYLAYWKKLRANGVKITNGWKEAYWGNFSAASDGKYPIVVSYASSPAATVYYSEKKLQESPTAAILGPETGFRQIEFVGILRGTKNFALAKKFVDFMLSPQFQQDIPLQMWVYPANKHTTLPTVFTKYAASMTKPAELNPDEIAAKRELWIQDWTTTVLQ